MDAPWNYDEKGCPTAADSAQKFGVLEYILVVDERKRAET